jgi:hypothetical protein
VNSAPVDVVISLPYDYIDASCNVETGNTPNCSEGEARKKTIASMARRTGRFPLSGAMELGKYMRRSMPLDASC